MSTSNQDPNKRHPVYDNFLLLYGELGKQFQDGVQEEDTHYGSSPKDPGGQYSSFRADEKEKELRDWMMDYPGPRSIVTEQCLNPVITVKMQPSHTERSGRLKSFQSRARMLKDAKGGAAPAYSKD